MRQPWRILRMLCLAASRARARGSERESDPRRVPRTRGTDGPPRDSIGSAASFSLRRMGTDHISTGSIRTVEKTQGGLHGHRSLMSRLGEWSWRAVCAAMLAVLLSQTATADLVGYIEDRAAVAGRSDKALIEANPILERLRREHPDALPAIIERLRAPLPSYRRGLERPVPEPKLESGVLAENPDLGQLYRESPEAALDLLRLIREAAKKK